MDFLKSIISFGWMKGYRTTVIVIFVVAGFVAEQFFGIDIPKVAFSWEDVLIALGIGTAASHVTK